VTAFGLTEEELSVCLKLWRMTLVLDRGELIEPNQCARSDDIMLLLIMMKTILTIHGMFLLEQLLE
jgi:hypothetical protein